MPALEDIKYDTLPAHMQEPIRLYIEEGRPLGDFLQSLLCNKLMQTFRHADAKNLAAIHEWLSFVYNEVPGDACGSEEAYEYWCDVGGYNSHFSLLRMKALAREKGIELSEEELKIAILSIGKKSSKREDQLREWNWIGLSGMCAKPGRTCFRKLLDLGVITREDVPGLKF